VSALAIALDPIGAAVNKAADEIEAWAVGSS
jgi:hypothetical protein